MPLAVRKMALSTQTVPRSVGLCNKSCMCVATRAKSWNRFYELDNRRKWEWASSGKESGKAEQIGPLVSSECLWQLSLGDWTPFLAVPLPLSLALITSLQAKENGSERERKGRRGRDWFPQWWLMKENEEGSAWVHTSFLFFVSFSLSFFLKQHVLFYF